MKVVAVPRLPFGWGQPVGLLLLVLSVFPAYRVLDRPETGLAGAATVSLANADTGFLWSGLLLAVALSLLTALLVQPARFESFLHRAAAIISRPSGVSWSAGSALVAGSGAVLFSLSVLDGQPNLIDAMSQLLHARFVAAGTLTGPGPELGEFWTMQQSVFAQRGWVSQYPPGHVVALAAGFAVGAVWLVGPLLLGLAVALLLPVADRLMPAAPVTARAAVFAVAVSPFVVAHAGAYSSHTTALALGVAAIYCALRAECGSGLWCLVAGTLLGAMLATRPLSAVSLGAALVLFLPAERGGVKWRLQRAGLLFGGAAPVMVALAAYNATLFGSPFRWGYQAALGPGAGLGFGIDPWGNSYGMPQAVGYVSAELSSLSLHLLGFPLPVVGVIALFLLTARRLSPGDRFLAAWALLPLTAHLAYWHHGLFMGPRMLNEMAPAWCLLGARAAVSLSEHTPVQATIGVSPRVLVGTLFVISLLGALWFGPERLWSYRQRPQAPAVASAAAGPALIFVHGGWTSRLATRLAAGGMRLDSVETALRQNPTCVVQAYADARASGRPLPRLDMEPRATMLPAVAEVSPGNRIRVADIPFTSPPCLAQAAADRLGVIDVSPLVWLGDLPSGAGDGTLFVRDQGPESNGRLLERHAHRTPYVLAPRELDGPPMLFPYEEGMELIWGGA